MYKVVTTAFSFAFGLGGGASAANDVVLTSGYVFLSATGQRLLSGRLNIHSQILIIIQGIRPRREAIEALRQVNKVENDRPDEYCCNDQRSVVDFHGVGCCMPVRQRRVIFERLKEISLEKHNAVQKTG